ncbi:hypothetical protein Y032_0141g2273 [Ancylostoma ceylanicum]|uniref:Uncharacterized protein n=1 Tax=Ancylostoma ceylanicum TaxID=53326 RepID=A0A016T487_9BILA|nr:hypothetical protein Y032_0141g2273 [Ancylostoma ceylanicum]
MRPFLFATVTLLILAVDRGAAIVVTRELLPHFKYHCDPSDPSSAPKCRGRTKYGLKEGFGFQRETQKNNIFCLKFKMCANYAYGTMMLAIRSAWDATGMVGKTDRKFPSDLVHSFVSECSYFSLQITVCSISNHEAAVILHDEHVRSSCCDTGFDAYRLRAARRPQSICTKTTVARHTPRGVRQQPTAKDHCLTTGPICCFTKFETVAESWYNRPDTKKTLKQLREEEREEKAEAAARAAAAAAAASTTAASATKTETTEDVSGGNSESSGDKIFRDEPVSEDYASEAEVDNGSTSPVVQEPMDVGPVPSALPMNALREAIQSWRH